MRAANRLEFRFSVTVRYRFWCRVKFKIWLVQGSGRRKLSSEHAL